MTDNERILALSPNSELCREIDRIVLRDTGRAIQRAVAGVSGSMNGSLDYTTLAIMAEVRKALKL